jgi:hypothetical protein
VAQFWGCGGSVGDVVARLMMGWISWWRPLGDTGQQSQQHRIRMRLLFDKQFPELASKYDCVSKTNLRIGEAFLPE